MIDGKFAATSSAFIVFGKENPVSKSGETVLRSNLNVLNPSHPHLYSFLVYVLVVKREVLETFYMICIYSLGPVLGGLYCGSCGTGKDVANSYKLLSVGYIYHVYMELAFEEDNKHRSREGLAKYASRQGLLSYLGQTLKLNEMTRGSRDVQLHSSILEYVYIQLPLTRGQIRTQLNSLT
ncbi:hypothetical protein J1N35_032228 [Gossypium stocksii]|uniref:Uncharacterized protein n=1 Tax=Gossypium stocksii TaxID=47602 RepID=A0A9D3V3C7_9ROSI|nr:hypothetical protein J1N35_032228 [Gossypium stocksii]